MDAQQVVGFGDHTPAFMKSKAKKVRFGGTEKKVLGKLLKRGASGVTPRDAMIELDMSGGTLTAAISHLRDAGHDILRVFDKDAKGKAFTRYVLVTA